MKTPIYICGFGNVGSSIYNGLSKSGIPVAGVFSRSPESRIKEISWKTYGQDVPKKNALVFICTPDDYIGETEKNLGIEGFTSVHCSGSASLEVLSNPESGVFWPLLSIRKGSETNWKGLPVVIETKNAHIYKNLDDICSALGAVAHRADTEQRQHLHLAAVFANNFSNALFDIAFDLAQKTQMDTSILLPLIQQTVAKLSFGKPSENQTGPAIRRDLGTITRHLELLSNDQQKSDIYRLITAYIQNH